MFTIQKHKVCGKSSYFPKILIFNLTLKEKTVKLRMSSFSEFLKKISASFGIPIPSYEQYPMKNVLLPELHSCWIYLYFHLPLPFQFLFSFQWYKTIQISYTSHLICCCYTSRYLNIGNIRGWFSRNLTSSELIALFFGMLNDSGSDHGPSIPHLSLAFTLIK